jgi:hypothetical protein
LDKKSKKYDAAAVEIHRVSAAIPYFGDFLGKDCDLGQFGHNKRDYRYVIEIIAHKSGFLDVF